jgi:basic membrane protein A and related proteins
VSSSRVSSWRRRAVAVAVLGALAVAALVLAGATSAKSAASQATPLKAAWIYVGPHNDAGWSQAHDMGRLYVQKKLGANVQTTFKENIANGPQLEQTVASLVRDGNKIIFGTSFGFFSKKLAAKYPDVLFEQATGTDLAKNMAEYFGAGEDSIYLSGMAAGAATKNGKIGYIAPFAIPEVIRHANAFALGAQAVNPKAQVKLIWTNAWYDPAKEKKAAESLVNSWGADVLGQNVDSPSAGQYAQSKGIPWVGYDANAKRFAPTSWLTAAVYDWGPYYLSRVKAAMNGTWKPGFYYGNIKDGFTDIAPYGPKVTTKTKAMIGAKRAKLVNGTFNVFAGPLYDQSGALKVPKGTTLKVLPDLYSMNWLVKGVVGSAKG